MRVKMGYDQAQVELSRVSEDGTRMLTSFLPSPKQSKDDDVTCILIHGFGCMSMEWLHVIQHLMEQHAGVSIFNYDRILLADPMEDGMQRDVDTLVQELMFLLHQRQLTPPYVVVGHSYGGLIAQQFASVLNDATDNGVVGMVLIDPAHERQYEMFPRDFVFGFQVMMPFIFRCYEMIASIYPIFLWMDRLSLFNFPPLFLLPPASGIRPLAVKLYSDPCVWKRVLGELNGCTTSFSRGLQENKNYRRFDFNLPIGLVVANCRRHTPTLWPQKVTDAFIALHRELIGRPKSRLFMANQSDHWVHMEEPAVVLAAVDFVLAEVSKSRA